VPCRFFVDERRSTSGIRVTDAFGQLTQGDQASNLPQETEARWRLVETGGSSVFLDLSLSSGTIPVTKRFSPWTVPSKESINGAREALSGYQKGHCFYCFSSFSLLGPAPPDVDHFFPHVLKTAGFTPPLDGVWNLVLVCPRCNRGPGGSSPVCPRLRCWNGSTRAMSPDCQSSSSASDAYRSDRHRRYITQDS